MILCQLQGSQGWIQECCTSSASTKCDQSSAALAAQLVSVQIAVHHTADGEGADLMACVLHDPTNEVDIAATNAQQSQFWLDDVSLYGFSCATSVHLECFVGNGYDGPRAP